MHARLTVVTAVLFSTLLPAGAAGADTFSGVWNMKPGRGTPWKSGDTLSITPGSASDVPGATGEPAWDMNVRGYCTGPPPPGGTAPKVSAWYRLTYTWSGGGRMGGCVSDKTNGQLIFFGQGTRGAIRGRSGDEILGDWTNNPNGSIDFTAKLAGEVTGGPGDGKSVKVSGLTRKVELKRGGAGWEPLRESDTLQPGDQVHTGWRSSVTITLPDGSKVVLPPMSLIAIDRIDSNGTQIILRLGEVKAQIHKLGGSSGDFVVKTPTTTASIRGTTFSVRYDGSSTVVGVTEGTVAVKPAAGSSVDVRAGQEVASTRTAVGPPAAIGQAGAPSGSVGPAQATALLTRALTRGFAACRVDVAHTTDSFALKPVAGGWRATLRIVGRRSGRAVWTIAGRRVAPRNALARRISRRCR